MEAGSWKERYLKLINFTEKFIHSLLKLHNEEIGYCHYNQGVDGNLQINFEKECVKMIKIVKALLESRKGQGMVEYGLLLSLLSVGAIGILVVLGPKVTAAFKAANDAW